VAAKWFSGYTERTMWHPVDQPIEVSAVFWMNAAFPHPLSFRWRRRNYTVRGVDEVTSSTLGQAPEHSTSPSPRHFATRWNREGAHRSHRSPKDRCGRIDSMHYLVRTGFNRCALRYDLPHCRWTLEAVDPTSGTRSDRS